MPKHAAVKPAVPVEHKVTATTGIAAALGIVIAVLNGLSDGSVLSALHVPEVYQGIILAVIPPLVVALAGYAAPHTTRTDVETPAVAAGSAPEPEQPRDPETGQFVAEPEPPVCGH